MNSDRKNEGRRDKRKGNKKSDKYERKARASNEKMVTECLKKIERDKREGKKINWNRKREKTT